MRRSIRMGEEEGESLHTLGEEEGERGGERGGGGVGERERGREEKPSSFSLAPHLHLSSPPNLYVLSHLPLFFPSPARIFHICSTSFAWRFPRSKLKDDFSNF